MNYHCKNYRRFCFDRSLKSKAPSELQICCFRTPFQASIGRIASQFIKRALALDKKDPKDLYVLGGIESLTFSKKRDLLVERYRTKVFDVGNRSKGPFTQKSLQGLFKLVLKGMIKHNAKHKSFYKKLRFMDTENFEKMVCKANYVEDLTSRRNNLTSKLQLKELLQYLDRTPVKK